MHQRPVEIERKWLVQDLPDLSRHEGKDVIQGYIAVAADGTEVRLRQTDGKFFETVKSGGDWCEMKSKSNCQRTSLRHSGRQLQGGDSQRPDIPCLGRERK